MNNRLLALSLTLGLCFAGAAFADVTTARTVEDIALRIGPDWRYERIGLVPKGRKVEVIRCLKRYNWCEIRWRKLSGWTSASRLRDTRDRFTDEPLNFYGSKLGITTYNFYPKGRDPKHNYYDDRGEARWGQDPARGEVCFYEHTHYQGAATCRTIIQSPVNFGGFWNDKISSLRLGPRTEILVCEDANMQGRCWRFSQDASNVGGANDHFSSYAPIGISRQPSRQRY